MTGFLILAIIVAVVAVVGVAQEFGVDSRPGSCDSRLPARDLTI
jgi:hypothetical protein